MTAYRSADHVPEPPDEHGDRLLAMLRTNYLRSGAGPSRPYQPEPTYPEHWNPTTRGQRR